MANKFSKHSLSKKLVECLRVFQEIGKPVKLKDAFLEISLSHLTNSVKLKHWKFIAKVTQPANHWRITKKGEDFLFGNIFVQKVAITSSDQLVRYEGASLNVYQVTGDFEVPRKHVYDEVTRDGQSTLFN